MSRIHLLLLLSALPLAACTADEGTVIPEGEHYTYVANRAFVPTSNPQATEFGLDLDGNKSVDNALGGVLAALVAQGLDVQAAIAEAVDEGSIILLLDLQTKDFASSGATGLQVKLGDKAGAMPQPCDATACRKHLDGNGSFSISSSSPDNVAVAGKIVGGTFSGGPGDISLQIALGGTGAVQLDLIGARAKATGMSATGIQSVILAGALPEDVLNNSVIPAIHGQIAPIIMDDCPGTTPPGCGCGASSTGKTILGLFDTTPQNCVVTVEEVRDNPFLKNLLSPDVTIKGRKALSLGLKIEAIKATIR